LPIHRVVTLLILTAMCAFSSSITWTINATLDDGASVTGFFVFDPDLGPQSFDNFDVNISAATLGTLSEPFDSGLPTSVFFPFDFNPVNSSGSGPTPGNDDAFEFVSNAHFVPMGGGLAEPLVFQFVPLSPLTDTSSTIITNSNIDVNDGHSLECFDCSPYVCFAGATSSLCTGSANTTPEPGELSLVSFGIAVLCGTSVVRRRRDWFCRTHGSISGSPINKSLFIFRKERRT
jgi:hypothetical protein